MNASLLLVVVAISACAATGVTQDATQGTEAGSVSKHVAADGTQPAAQRAADLAPPVPVMAGGRPIEVGGFAAPFVGDFDGDGKNDLLVGQRIQGRLRIYRNTGTNAEPKFDTFEWFKAGGEVAGVPRCCLVAFTPQLVDFDNDGDTDILTGSGLTGEVFLYRRKADGTFDEAEVLENREGQVLMHRRTREGKTYPRRYNVTALAYDWDNDGDADLLLGHTPLCLVLNISTAGEPSFDSGRLIECDGHPILGGLASTQIADWDGDGLDDLVAGLRHDIVWYRNVGQRGRPKFEGPRMLVPSPKSTPNRSALGDQPHSHHAFCVADFNGDGRLDLLVGDRFLAPFDEEEQGGTPAIDRETLNALDKQNADLRNEPTYDDLRNEPTGETRQERITRYRRQLRAWQDYEVKRLAKYETDRRHRGNVWLYERVAQEGGKTEPRSGRGDAPESQTSKQQRSREDVAVPWGEEVVAFHTGAPARPARDLPARKRRPGISLSYMTRQ